MSLWLLGGHDPTHGAGLYRDLATARRLDAALPRCFAVTALTDQGRGRPAQSHAVPASRLRARVRRWPPPRAIKLGLVPDALAETVAELVADTGAPVVMDPVLRATDGGELGATPHGLAPLLAVATLVTPNRTEALALLEVHLAREGAAPVGPEIAAESLAAALGRSFPAAAILLKDGHGTDPARVTDRLIRGAHVVELARPRVPGPDPRGTGCALATAIATGLARGTPLEPAVARAIAWLDVERRRWHPGPDGRAHLPDAPP